MTVFFVTSYDEATHANLVCARNIVAPDDILLFAEAATRENIFDSINGPRVNNAVFVMSHGTLDLVRDNNQDEAINRADIGILSGQDIFAWACLTGRRLGYYLSRKNNRWFGYDGVITPPPEQQPFANIFSPIFRFAKENFSTMPIDLFLDKLKFLCDRAIENLDQVGANDHPDTMEIYLCCRQIWGRLVVWTPQINQPLHHPNTLPPMVDL